MPTPTSSGNYRGDPTLTKRLAKVEEDNRQLRARSNKPGDRELLVRVQATPPVGPTGTAWLDTSVTVSGP